MNISTRLGNEENAFLFDQTKRISRLTKSSCLSRPIKGANVKSCSLKSIAIILAVQSTMPLVAVGLKPFRWLCRSRVFKRCFERLGYLLLPMYVSGDLSLATRAWRSGTGHQGIYCAAPSAGDLAFQMPKGKSHAK